jgi:hypothetical protein
MSDQQELRCNYHCAAEVVRSRQRTGQPIPEWLRRHYNRLDAEVRVSQSRHEIDCGVDDAAQSEHPDQIGTREAATMLKLSKRQVQRLAGPLGGRIVGAAWVFNRDAVTDYAERRDHA